jgi:hypothetical protein
MMDETQVILAADDLQAQNRKTSFFPAATYAVIHCGTDWGSVALDAKKDHPPIRSTPADGSRHLGAITPNNQIQLEHGEEVVLILINCEGV